MLWVKVRGNQSSMRIKLISPLDDCSKTVEIGWGKKFINDGL